MQRYFIALLCLGFVRATLQNFTLDDTSSDILYSFPTFNCDSTSCPPEVTEGLFNRTATLTFGSITFSFTGTAFYASLDLVGTCSISVDGDEIGTLNTSFADAILGVSKSDMANAPHTLVIAPTTEGTVIGFDHLIYTASLPAKRHVGEIVGGVIGGVVLTVGTVFAVLYARRRRLILRRNQRKSAVLRGISTLSIGV